MNPLAWAAFSADVIVPCAVIAAVVIVFAVIGACAVLGRYRTWRAGRDLTRRLHDGCGWCSPKWTMASGTGPEDCTCQQDCGSGDCRMLPVKESR